MAGCRVLLLYPNERDVSLVPPVFGLFAALLRERGHETTLFDCTGYDMEGKVDPDIEREKALFLKPTGPSTDKRVKQKLTNMYDDFTEKVQTFSPDLIAISVTESTFLRGVSLLNHLRLTKKHNILTIIGYIPLVLRYPPAPLLCWYIM